MLFGLGAGILTMKQDESAFSSKESEASLLAQS